MQVWFVIYDKWSPSRPREAFENFGDFGFGGGNTLSVDAVTVISLCNNTNLNI